ncbi:MAG: excinuclease ABC subunit UvrC [Prevotellaceae bacterium]|jgi:excinuclease ABC subunit C|nr:excinuclease ABC subunit UvrC [Prevotellaceae bacterium]
MKQQDKNKVQDIIKEKVALLPSEPGVYQFFDASNKIIYIGKAKDLKKRVSTYFFANNDRNAKLQVMVNKICDIRHIITPSESDALLLENNMIKKYQPRYNVLLKDDKTFPWICVKNENFPKIILTRRKSDDGSKYFGPYTSVGMAKMLLNLIKQICPIRTCRLLLTPEGIAKGKYSVCLDFHIGNCKGPCKGLQSETEYMEFMEQAKEIINGNIGSVTKILKSRMNIASKKRNFEEAQSLKEKINRLKQYQSKSIIVNPSINNVDVISFILDGNMAYSNFIRVVKGSIVQSYSIETRLAIEEDREVLLSTMMMEIKQRLNIELSKKIVVPFIPDTEFDKVTYIVPQKGDKLKLLKFSEKNVNAYRFERLKQMERIDPEKHIERILSTVQYDLHLKEMPRRIECFDNSNIQGTNPVAACVVFVNAKPAKKEYRHFNIKTVEGPDDFASMKEVVHRRYSRLLKEGAPLPQLIVIDGGKGQLNAAADSLEKLDLIDKIPVLGLAKRLEEIYFHNDSIPLLLNKNSETLKVLMHIRDEAHRFGISFHRTKRSSNFIRSELRTIKGVGEITAKKLMLRFKTISAIKQASQQELIDTVGKRAAELIRAYFNAHGSKKE